ncbi:MAG: DNA mismatch endonuclease Vsr [Planctomycetes bacterium]|nr:DNA mismatch endonuclease Vsr [Planctomycetota bacterium]
MAWQAHQSPRQRPRRHACARRVSEKPELELRRRLHAMGFRYRVDAPPLKGMRRRADVVFGKARVAVFVDGCFWHRCPEHSTIPKSNRNWWLAKLEANVQRDRDTDAWLRERGWCVIRSWEHEDPDDAARRVVQAVRGRLTLPP